jgi:hypothetical protein
MKRAAAVCLLVATSLGAALAQAPVGIISGKVTDESGGVIPGASILIKNKTTGAERHLVSAEDGAFSVPGLPAGIYEVRVEAKGFRTIVREATVETGATTTSDIGMPVGEVSEVVSVQAATSQIEYERHAIDGVITRQKIQELPLNGRSFLQLAFLEPGVTVSPGTTAQYNSLFSVSVLGAESNKTAITVDGGNVRNAIEGQTQINLSQEVVQEFQLSSANFDLSTGITSSGAVNIVTRQGGNDFHGSGYFYFRDHNMSAYPHLARNPLTPDPFFARRNPGFWVGGPIKKDKAFFFFNYEYMNQVQVFSFNPDLPSLTPLTSVNYSPYRGTTLSLRLDYRLASRHELFVRYSHDGNEGFGPNAGSPLPSNWLRNTNFSDQSVLGFTSTLTPTVVNEFRFNYTYWQNRNLFPRPEDCPGCVGLGFPSTTMQGSTNFVAGNTLNATQGRDLRRFTFTDGLTWQKGTHRFRIGTEIEHAPGTGFWGYCDPACTSVFSIESVRGLVPAQFLPLFNLPSSVASDADLLRLPFAGGVVGVGDPSQPPPYNIEKAKPNNRYRLYLQDTWRLRPHFTLNYGLSWQFESTLVNRDLDKPAYLQPLYGSDLSATDNNYNNFSPALGFAWNVGNDNKTVVRAGGGIYWETELLWRRLQERAFIGPVGNGRIQFPHTGFVNIYPNIINFNTQQPVAVGAPLPSNTLTNLTLGQFMEIYRQQIGAVNASLTPSNPNDLSVRAIDINKAAAQLYPKSYPVQRSYHMTAGVQRELRHDLVLSVDFVRRVFSNTLLGEVDYNRYNRFINGVRTPVIRPCATQELRVPGIQCSSGPITFWTPAGRGVYNAMLVKADKRFSSRYLFTVSYALTDEEGINGVTNLDNYFESFGPQGARHILNASAIVDLPWGVQASFISATASRGPVTANVTSVDLNGDGTTTTPIPGVAINTLNRGSDRDDLAAAVQAWNQSYPAGSRDARGQPIPQLILPPSFGFGDTFNTQDVRLTKNFTWGERYQISVFGEMFNVFNVANLSGFNYNLDTVRTPQTFAFGRPTQRVNQVFGSGGPRALQLGFRVSF